MYTQELRIPKERIGALVGIKGRMKRKIQRRTDTQIVVNADGEVYISGEDSLRVFMALTVIRAISRGFNPDIALVLLEEDNALEVVDMTEFSRKNSNDLTRIRARVIGTNGKAREMLESLTKTKFSVYGKTVAIIGTIPDVMLAKGAVEKLLQGAPHNNVYHFIEKQHASMREKF